MSIKRNPDVNFRVMSEMHLTSEEEKEYFAHLYELFIATNQALFYVYPELDIDKYVYEYKNKKKSFSEYMDDIKPLYREALQFAPQIKWHADELYELRKRQKEYIAKREEDKLENSAPVIPETSDSMPENSNSKQSLLIDFIKLMVGVILLVGIMVACAIYW